MLFQILMTGLTLFVLHLYYLVPGMVGTQFYFIIMQGMVWNVVSANVNPYILIGPIHKWIEFESLTIHIFIFVDLQLCAFSTLHTPMTCNPNCSM